MEEQIFQDLSAFYAQNAGLDQLTAEVKISKRLPAFKIRAVSGAENGAIQKASTRPVSNVTKNGKRVQRHEFDIEEYTKRVLLAGVEFPNLHDKALQESYGVFSAEELIGVMLTATEQDALFAAITSFGELDDDALEEEAKN
jgi:hypothetical protein